MDLQKFDSTLKSALENIEVPFDASTWAALENRLDALPAPDSIDKVLRPALERIETSYDASTWSALANRLDTIARVRRLRLTKVAELAIFLLLLLNLKGFFGVVESVTNPVPAKKEIPEPIAKGRATKGKKQETVAPFSAEQNKVTETNQSLASQVVAFVQNLASTLTQDEEHKNGNPEANTPQTIAKNTSFLDPANFYSQSGIVKFPVGTPLPARPAASVLFASNIISMPGIDISKTPKPTRFYAASFGSFDQNYLREGNHSERRSGYGGGFAVGYRKGKWGVEAGLQYSQKHYQPKQDKVTYQNDLNGISFYNIDNVDAEVFSVPVQATRQLVKFRKSSAHAVAGVTANFATSKIYGYKTEHKPPSQVSGSHSPAIPLPNGKGVLENGGLTHNAYATADLGLRIEQSLGKRYVAFVEPIYRQSLGGGLGPNSARLSTFSLQAGVMASL